MLLKGREKNHTREIIGFSREGNKSREVKTPQVGVCVIPH